MQIHFIGGGAMGEALIKSLLIKKIASSEAITVSDVSKQRRDYLQKTYKVKTAANNKLSNKTDVIILAIKPQDFSTVAADIKGLSPRQLVLSILAGTTLETLKEGLQHSQIIRSMPNMPAQIGEGMTVWTATEKVTEKQKQMAKSILSACGEELYVKDEKYIDMATALSGSGPAYIYLIIEALTDAGVHIGMPRAIAEKLVIETMIGSAKSIKLMAKHPAELKNMVTSPGGTSTEGLLQLETGGLRSLLLRAVIATYEKARSLGTRK